MSSCPECSGTVMFADEPRVSEIVECVECRSELEVITLEPLTLAVAPDVEEDWGE
jgi:alpha-aminoadipate/glutamate carrier protein LysW